jgi:PAS domain S-box-containing protein
VPDSLIDLVGLQVGAEDFLVAVLETTAQPIWVVDTDGMIRFANPAAIATLGYDSADELFGCHSHETIHHTRPDGTPYPAADCPMLLPRVTGETVTSELDWFFRRDGSMFPVSYVSVPLDMHDGRGAVVAFTDIEDRIRAERQLRDRDEARAAQQATLRRVAALVAGGAASTEVFAAVAREVASLLDLHAVAVSRYEPEGTVIVLGAWSDRPQPFETGTRWPLDGQTIAARVKETGGPVRLDYAELPVAIAEAARAHGIRSGAGAPIVVDGRVWGVMATWVRDREPVPDGIEDRLAELTALIAAAFSNTASRDEVARLADEQAALRRVATLVAEESPPAQLFATVAEEVARLLGSNIDSAILRYQGDEAATVVGVWGEQRAGGIRVGARLPVDGSNVSAQVLRERRSVRVDDYLVVDGAIADHAQEHGIRPAVGCPILVQGRLWGAMIVAHNEAEAFPPDTERRVAQFTELMATAIANTEARTEVQRLAEEQAALRRVATLVAEGAAPTEVFDAVVVEVAQLLGAAQVGLMRFEGSDEITILAHRGQDPAFVQAGMRLPLDGDSVTVRVQRSGRSARVNLYEERSGTIAAIAQGSQVKVTVGAPIVVEGALWGVMTASWTGEDLPPSDAEERLAEFAELVDTAIANADSRDQLMASRARVLTAGDEARRRVVRDLHDGAQQRLVNTIVTLKLARRAVSDDGQQAEALLSEALAQAEQGNAELRELVHGILPSVLTRGGLRAAVESLVARLHLLVEVDVTSTRLASEVEASAYFIVAEALTNVVKHAQATCAEVTAAVDNGTLRVAVRDDGTGGADPEGHGLQGISDRVAALGGRLRIDSSRGAGTRLTAELPLAGRPPGEGLRSAPSNAEGRPV